MVEFTTNQIVWVLTHPAEVPLKSLVYSARALLEMGGYQFDKIFCPFYTKLLKSYRLVACTFDDPLLKAASSWTGLYSYFEREANNVKELRLLENTFEGLLAKVASDFPTLEQEWDIHITEVEAEEEVRLCGAKTSPSPRKNPRSHLLDISYILYLLEHLGIL